MGQRVKKRAIAVLLLVTALMLVFRGSGFRGDPAQGDGSREEAGVEQDGKAREGGGPAAPRPPRMSERPDQAAPRPTHGPQRLRDFRLPSLEIEGESLADALERVRVEYQRICDLSGEVPLALRFELPADPGARLHLTLPAGSLDAAIRHLAAMSGLRVARDGKTYRLEEETLAAGVIREFRVPPDFQARLEALGGLATPLDPTTRWTFKPADSTLRLETSSGADLARIEGLVEVLQREMPLQTKLDAMLVEFPAGSEAPEPPASMDPEGLQAFLRQLAGTEGGTLKSLPSVVTRPGQEATVELAREFIYPDPAEEGGFAMEQVGQVLKLTPEALGFGHGVEFSYTDSEPDVIDGRAAVRQRVGLEEDVYLGDQRSGVFRQTRDDGSSTLLVITPTLIDPTGRPLAKAAGE